MVNLILSGMSAKALANHCGWDSLRVKKQLGKPSKLDAEQIEKIKAAVLSAPAEYGFNV